jgi:hypothetical protein
VVHLVGIGIAVIVAAGAAAPSPRQDGAVAAAYRKFYAGEPVEAQRDFERLVAADPASLPARFGLLSVVGDIARTEPALETEFARQLDLFLRDADTRRTRSAADDEALFYAGNGYLLRSLYRLRKDSMWAAARDAARAKRLAEAYVKRHPEHGDAYLALGSYNYYVAIAPAFVRVLRVFLLLPSGNRTEGLKQIERAYREGSLFSPYAALVLMEIYGTYEGRTQDALRIGERLAREYPGNPLVQLQLAQLYFSPAAEDYVRAGEQFEAAIGIEVRRGGSRPEKYLAQLGLAASLEHQWRLDDAIKVLTATIDAAPPTPAWVMPRFLLRRANYRALTADVGAAEDARRVLANGAWKDRHKQARDLVQWMDKRRTSGEATVYAALIPGNRFAAERRLSDAETAYESVRRRYPDDPQVRYRLSALQFARGETEGSIPAFTAVSRDRNAPGWLKAEALLHVGRAHDLAGRRAEAKTVYDRIVDDFERERAADAARIGLVVPYRR